MKSLTPWFLFGVITLAGTVGAQPPAAPGGKMAATAIVVLTPIFCTVEVTQRAVGQVEVFEAGPSLCSVAEEAVRNSFERVIRMETPPAQQDAGSHLILIPRYVEMVATDTPMGANGARTLPSILENRSLALLVEWTAKDPSGKILWVQAIEGDATKAHGFNHRKILEMATRDVAGTTGNENMYGVQPGLPEPCRPTDSP